MRRSKSDPAKYARNYRKISQRRMTQYDNVDEEKEMERLRSVLRDSERQLKQVEEPEEDDTANSRKKRKRAKDRPYNNGNPTSDNESNEAGILSKELRAELSGYGGGGDENHLVILPSKKKKKKDKKDIVQLSPEEIREAKAVQKKTTRKLQQLEERAAKKKKRAELYKRLEESQVVPQSQLQPLLQSSGKLSRKESTTKKQALKKILTKERAGLSLTQEEKELLYPEHEVDEEDNYEATGILNGANEMGRKAFGAELQDDQTLNNATTESNSKGDEPQSHDLWLQTGRKSAAQGKDNKESATSNSSLPGTDFASLMMASLSKLKKDTAENPKSKPENTLNDLSQLAEPEKRYIPVNPTVVKTAASMGLHPASHDGGQKRKVVEIKRPAEVEESRYSLPVSTMEFEIIDAIRNNDVTIICGETGSGKSTQVPAFL
jgi:hypothetical protein